MLDGDRRIARRAGANAISFLVSSDGDWVNGQVLRFDPGISKGGLDFWT